jgi:hypothetical protein
VSTAYVPVPAVLPATITVPQDLVDQRSAASVNVPFASLADAIAYLMLAGSTDRSRSCTSDLVMIDAERAKSETMIGATVAAAETLSAANALLYADHLRFNVVNAGAAVALHVFFPLNSILISGATVTSVKATLQGGPGHGALPAMMPALSIVRVKVSDNTQVGMLAAGMTDDASGGVGAYEAIHTIEVIPDQNATIDFADQAQYYAVFCQEGSTNALAELKLYGITVRMSAPRYQR